jgi:hypothetical protein
MREPEMAWVANVMCRAAVAGEPAERLAREVEEFLAPFQRLRYSFDQ